MLLQIYSVLLPKLQAQDIDQEVKEEAINCAALLIISLGEKLPDLNDCLLILLDRLSNEITRLITVRSLELIAGSSSKINLSAILLPAVNQLTNFLRLVSI